MKRLRVPWTRTLAGLAGAAAAAYPVYVGTAWLRYGHARQRGRDASDDLLDRFMPAPDIDERHSVQIAAPADVTFAALMDLDLEDSPIIRAIFKGRELLLGAEPERHHGRRGLVAMTKALGWGVLAERPGREIVMGAITQPWEANVQFRSLPPDQFETFNTPGFVKIVWTLRADALDAQRSIARTETRAVATDAAAGRRFRWYWARFSAGIVLIRRVSMRLVKAEAERRAAAS